MSRLPKEFFDKLSDDEKERYLAMIESKKKVKALATDILMECQRQNFTIEEFEMLARRLTVDGQTLVEKCKKTSKAIFHPLNLQNLNHEGLGKTNSTT